MHTYLYRNFFLIPNHSFVRHSYLPVEREMNHRKNVSATASVWLKKMGGDWVLISSQARPVMITPVTKLPNT